MDLTAGEAEIRDGLGGTEGRGWRAPGVCKEPVFQKKYTHITPVDAEMGTLTLTCAVQE